VNTYPQPPTLPLGCRLEAIVWGDFDDEEAEQGDDDSDSDGIDVQEDDRTGGGPLGESDPTPDPSVGPSAESPSGAKIGAVLGQPETAAPPAFDPLDLDTQRAIFDTRRAIVEHDTEIAVLSSELKAEKAKREEAVQRLMTYLRRMEIEAAPNLFNQGQPAPATGTVSEGDGAPPEPTCDDRPDRPAYVELKDAAQEEDTSWKEVPLTVLIDLGAPKKAIEACHAKGLHTIDDLRQFCEPNPVSGWQQRVTDIDGIGEKTGEKIDAALERFWSERPDRKPGAES
jgi:hypothetical protein